MEDRDQLEVLLLANVPRGAAATVVDHVGAFLDHSRHQVHHVDPYYRIRPSWVDPASFDVVVIHYTLFTPSPIHLDRTWVQAISRSAALKVMLIQDEYRNIDAVHERIRALGIDLLFTCVPEGEIEKVYPPLLLPGVSTAPTLTGFVPDYLAEVPPPLDHPRSLDVGYRGRGGLWWLGDLYREKTWIAERFAEVAAAHPELRVDLSSREEDRLYGPAWTDFLRSCRWTLGTESGANVFDFSGSIETKVRLHLEQAPETSYQEIHALYLAEHEGRIRLNQISPRAFEATGFGCGMVLFEGEYSGILEPDVHFVPLAKDFSNIDEVLGKIRDEELRVEMVKRTYQDLIASGRYSYQAFVARFDDRVEEEWRARLGEPGSPREARPRRSAGSLPGMLARLLALPFQWTGAWATPLVRAGLHTLGRIRNRLLTRGNVLASELRVLMRHLAAPPRRERS